MVWARTVEPAVEPLTLAEAKAQARITDTQSDNVLLSYIKTARDAAEQSLGRGLVTQTWQAGLPDFADVIWLPMAAPLQSVTSVTYYDSDGTLQTLATSYYTVDTLSRPGRIVRAANQCWPAVQCDRLDSAVLITYVVGWTTPALVPERIKQGLRTYVTYLDADRDGLTAQAQAALDAAEACWIDKVYHLPPEWCA